MTTPPLLGLVLAAGQGTRMKSDRPKVVHKLAGLPMVEWVVRAVAAAGVPQTVVVVGNGAQLVRDALKHYDVDYVEQMERRGTGHAVMVAQDVLEKRGGLVLITAGDTPLLNPETLKTLITTCSEPGVSCAMATAESPDAGSYGRIVRGPDGGFERIVEAKDATPEQRAIKEWNPGLYCFRIEDLLPLLSKLSNSNASGEYYLTDVLGLLVQSGKVVRAEKALDSDQFIGVDDRWKLALLNQTVQEDILRKHAEAGVTIVDTRSTVIEADVVLGRDVTIHPNSVLSGKTSVGDGSEVGRNSWVKDAVIGKGCFVRMSHVERATLEDGSRCGPFANLRPDAHLAQDVKIGNFVEIKNARIGNKAAVSHLSYIGDAIVGARANIGAGTITCNYDGFSKHRTVIGDEAFVGSNSTLVAPVIIGDEAFVAAGSVITENVESGDMAFGRVREQVNKKGLARKKKDEWQNRAVPDATGAKR